MKAKTILTTLALLTFLCVQPANAQLGNLVNKAKQKAKETVENATKNVKNTATETVQEKKQETVEKTQQTVEKTQETAVQQAQAQVEQNVNKPKPTPEAIAGDSLALREDILPGFTKSIGEIHALYETLDPQVYPNRPYYNRGNSTFYRMHTKLSNMLHDEIFYDKYRKKANEFYGSTFEEDMYSKMEDGYYAAGADKAISAGFAQFRCDPYAITPFKQFLHSRSILDCLSSGFLRYMVYNNNERQIRTKDPNERELLREGARETANRLRPEANRLGDIVTSSKMPVSILEEAANYYHDLVKKNIDNNDFQLFDWMEYGYVVDYLGLHPDLGKTSELYKKHNRYLDDFKYAYDEFTRKGNEKFNPLHQPIKMANIPPAKAHDAALEADMKRLATAFYNDGRVAVKALIISPQWQITRNPFGAIIDRTRSANIVFRMKDKSYRLVNLNFKQVYNGGSYGKTQVGGVGLTDSPISDYKE